MAVLHLAGQTTHARKGAIDHVFRHGVDYLMLDAEADGGAGLFSRNGRNLVAVCDVDHGGPPGRGRGPAWVRDVLASRGLPAPQRIRLLAQPRLLGHVFNPVSFWFCEDDRGLRVLIAEVTNTYGDRHAYLCHKPDLAPIGPEDRLGARKIFHVSPFQEGAGDYVFQVDLRPDRLRILIDFAAGSGGLTATLSGALLPLTTRGLLAALIRRPFGGRRVLALIHWQALRLWAKGAGFRPRPAPPETEVS